MRVIVGTVRSIHAASFSHICYASCRMGAWPTFCIVCCVLWCGDASSKSHDVIIQVSWPSIQFIAFFSICVLAALAASCAPFSMPHASSDHCEVTACVAWTCLWASFLWGVLYPWWSWYYQYVLASGIMYHYICISLFLSIDTCSCRPRWPALKAPYG